MTKKAQLSTLQVMIIGLVIAIVLFAAFIIWTSVLRNKSNIEVCRLSAMGKAHTKLFNFRDASKTSPLWLECPRTYIKFFNNKVTSRINDKEETLKLSVKGKKTDKFDELTDKIVFQVAAEELRKCWYKMLEGKPPTPFDQKLLKDNDICLLCAQLDFDEELKEDPVVFEDFQSYLDKNDMIDSDMKYSDYLTMDVYGNQLSILFFFDKRVVTGEELAIENLDDISSDQSYYIMFLSYNPEMAEDYIKWLLNPIYPFQRIYHLISGKPMGEQIFGIMSIVKADEISSLGCDLLYN